MIQLCYFLKIDFKIVDLVVENMGTNYKRNVVLDVGTTSIWPTTEQRC